MAQQTIYLNDEQNGVRRTVRAEGRKIFLTLTADSEVCKLALSFYCGRKNEENIAFALSMAEQLAGKRRRGFALLHRYAREHTPAQQPPADGLLGGLSGYWESEVAVRDGHLYYTLESMSVGMSGEAHFDFGAADEKAAKRIANSIRRFEQDALMSAAYLSKHKVIDGE